MARAYHDIGRGLHHRPLGQRGGEVMYFGYDFEAYIRGIYAAVRQSAVLQHFDPRLQLCVDVPLLDESLRMVRLKKGRAFRCVLFVNCFVPDKRFDLCLRRDSRDSWRTTDNRRSETADRTNLIDLSRCCSSRAAATAKSLSSSCPPKKAKFRLNTPLCAASIAI